MTPTPDASVNKWLMFRLNPGFKGSHLATFFFASFIGLALMGYTSISKDFLLTTFLKIPAEEQGRVAGNLQSFREIIVLLAIGLGGVVSDKIGRRILMVAGFALLGLSYLLFPLAADVPTLMGFYVINAIGAALITGMLSTIFADYIFDQDRGKASGVQGVIIAVAIVLAALALKSMPKWLTQPGRDEVAAGRLSYQLIAAMAFAAALILWFGLSSRFKAAEERKSFGQLVREGAAAGREPGVFLSYLSAFVSRGDLVVVGTFLSIWISNAGRASGLTAAAAAAYAGKVLAIGGPPQLLGAPLVGWLADRMNRVTVLILASLVGFVAYTATILVRDPLGKDLLIVMVLIGFAQIAGTITSQVIVSQQAPAAIRGSVIGFYGLCGALAQILISLVGGRLFSGWRECGPFVLVGILNLLLAIVAWVLRGRVSNRPVNP